MSKHTNTFAKETSEELHKILAEKRESLREFRFSTKGTRVRNIKEGANLRKDIARILFRLGSMTPETVTK
jgi:ribosomal protein L29